MIEEIIIVFLTKKGFSAFMEEPREKTEEYIVIEKTGSSKNNYIKNATVAIQSYASTLYDASCLNEKVKEAMEQLNEKDEVVSSKLNTDYNFTDTSKKKYRYQAIFEIVHY